MLDDPGGYGRVVRHGAKLVGVVEQADASPEVRAIDEVSILLFAFRRRELFRALPSLDRKNRQREYYLNRVVPALIADGEKVIGGRRRHRRRDGAQLAGRPRRRRARGA